MPTINRIQPKPKKENKEDVSNHKLLRRKLYGTRQWQKVRLTFLKEHPLCAECLRHGKVTPAEDVHHRKSPFNYAEQSVNWDLALDSNNLEALCKECHQKEHNPQSSPSPEEVLRQLEELMKDISD